MAEQQERTWARIAATRHARGEPKDFAVGDLVALKLPRDVRGAVDSQNLECRVVEVLVRGPARSYRLRCNAGVLDTVQPGDNLTLLPAASAAQLTFGAEEAWEQVRTVPLGGAVLRQGRGAVIKCGCR